MAPIYGTLIPRDLPGDLKAFYKTLLDVVRENEKNGIDPPTVIVITDLAKDYDDLLAMMMLKEFHRLGLIKLRGFVANLEPAGKRADFGRGALDLLGLDFVPIAEGTRGFPKEDEDKHKLHDYEFDCPFMKERKVKETGRELLYRLLIDTLDGKHEVKEEVIILCLSSLRDIAEFSREFPNLLSRALGKGKAVLQGGYSVVDGNLMASVVNKNLKIQGAANNNFDPTAAIEFHKFLQEKKIQTMVFDRNAALNLKRPLPRTMFTDMARTGEIGQYLDRVAERQESKFFLDATGPPENRFGYKAPTATDPGSEGHDWNRYKDRVKRWPKDKPQPATFDELRPYTDVIAYDALAALGVLGKKFIDKLKIIKPRSSEWPDTIHQVVGNGSEPDTLDGTVDGMRTALEALLRGSLLAVLQGLSSDHM
ncbi:hypothetical protein B0J14DRAFT_704702 [Halenospora varia]|nr:hypothetical protein B0J14DRAFT_704702 [Halenospora varia]